MRFVHEPPRHAVATRHATAAPDADIRERCRYCPCLYSYRHRLSPMPTLLPPSHLHPSSTGATVLAFFFFFARRPISTFTTMPPPDVHAVFATLLSLFFVVMTAPLSLPLPLNGITTAFVAAYDPRCCSQGKLSLSTPNESRETDTATARLPHSTSPTLLSRFRAFSGRAS